MIKIGYVLPVEAQSMNSIIPEAKHLNPDVFVAFSYPPDTMAITGQARLSSFNPKVFYTAIGTAFPMFKQRFDADAEGAMGSGGWNADAPGSEDYFKWHVAETGQEPDRWARPITYASLQILQQAIGRVGEVDRAAVTRNCRQERSKPSSD